MPQFVNPAGVPAAPPNSRNDIPFEWCRVVPNGTIPEDDDGNEIATYPPWRVITNAASLTTPIYDWRYATHIASSTALGDSVQLISLGGPVEGTAFDLPSGVTPGYFVGWQPNSYSGGFQLGSLYLMAGFPQQDASFNP